MADHRPTEAQQQSDRPTRYRRVPNTTDQRRNTQSDGEHADASDTTHSHRNNYRVNDNTQANHQYYSRNATSQRSGGGDNGYYGNEQQNNEKSRRHNPNGRIGRKDPTQGPSTEISQPSEIPADFRMQQQHAVKSKVQPRTIVDGTDETLADSNFTAAKTEASMTSAQDLKRIADSTCNVCLMNRREPIYGVLDDACKHFFCYVCAVRLRTICQDNRCPVCRVETKHIFLTRMLAPTKNDQSNSDCPVFEKAVYKTDDEAGLIYGSEQISRLVHEQLFRHKCPKCQYSSAAFNYMEQHARETHDLFYCHTCLNHLRLFTYERRAYGKEALFDHIRVGDGVTGSALTHGHPKCQICNARTFDRDEQLRHNRREHHVCYCCEWGPKRKIVVFEDMLSMRKHMKKDHFVCEMDMCGEIVSKSRFDFYVQDPPRAFNERQDLELHQVESHNRRDLSAELFFNLSFRRNEPSSSAAGHTTSSASANDRASAMAAPMDAPPIGRGPPPAGPIVNARNNLPTWTDGRDSSLSTGRIPSSSRGRAFAAQADEFPTIAGVHSRDPLETMLLANRLHDGRDATHYPRLQASNAGNLNDVLNKKMPKAKPPLSLEHRAAVAPSSAAAKQPQPQKRREDEFPSLSGNGRIPPGLPQPTAHQQSKTVGGSNSSTSSKATSSNHATFAARVQQSAPSPAGAAKGDKVKADAAGDKQQPSTSKLVNKPVSEKVAASSVNEFPSLGSRGDSKKSNEPRWVPPQVRNNELKRSTENKGSNDAVDQTAALLKRLSASSRSTTAASAMDAADRYNQYLASGRLADEDEDARDAFPGMAENNERERSDMGPWWRRANEKPGNKKPKTVWKKK